MQHCHGAPRGGQVQPQPAAFSDVEAASCRLEGNDGFESRSAKIHLKMLQLIMSPSELSV